MLGWIKKRQQLQGQKNIGTEKQAYRIPTVKFDPARVTEIIEADLQKNINSLDEVGPSEFAKIYDAALCAISAGGRLDILYQALITIEGISKRRAEEISLLLGGKATALVELERQKQLGIKYAIWCHSGAPCGGTKQNSAHKRANGKCYSLSNGMLLNGKWTWPGRDDGCKCTPKPLIPGINDHAIKMQEGVSE